MLIPFGLYLIVEHSNQFVAGSCCFPGAIKYDPSHIGFNRMQCDGNTMYYGRGGYHYGCAEMRCRLNENYYEQYSIL